MQDRKVIMLCTLAIICTQILGFGFIALMLLFTSGDHHPRHDNVIGSKRMEKTQMYGKRVMAPQEIQGGRVRLEAPGERAPQDRLFFEDQKPVEKR
jgi:hypothetical protein